MEVQARELMERQCACLDDYPTVQARLRQHLAATYLAKKSAGAGSGVSELT
jgi:hypothetical protein